MPGVAEDQPAKGRLRRIREGLLLELGALVYELHRQGRRAPELLRRKAGELSEVDERLRDQAAEEAAPGSCPGCGAEAEPDQLVCTNCGTRLALARRPPDRGVWAPAALLAVVALAAGAAGFALSEITSDGADDAPAAEQATETTPAPAAAKREPERADRPEARATVPSREPRRSPLLDWPDDLTAHTVVLVTTSDRAAALRLARQAARTGIEAGLLRSDDYGLGSGLWIVFAGRFDTPEGAARQSSDLAERFPGAYPQRIVPAGQAGARSQ